MFYNIKHGHLEERKSIMLKKIYVILFLIVSFTVLIIPAISQNDEGLKASKVDELFKGWDNPNSPGAAIAIVREGKVILQREYGMANLEYDIPITSSTVFHIASVSKQFTAFSILLLEDEGKLSLDDNIHKYLPDVPDFGETIRIRHLIHHLSGLREQETLFQLSGISNADVIQTEHILKLVHRQKKLNFRPGDEIEYCNTGYVLLAEIVERVTGKSFREWTAENIFKPLGMNNTQFYDDNTRIVKNRAYPYWIPDGTELIKGTLNYSYVGSTSLFTTSEEMAKWLINFGDPNVGNQKIMRKMQFKSGLLNSGEDSTYGFGIGVTNYKGLKVILHSGHDAGYRAYDAYFPEQKFGIAILSNFYSINPSLLGRKIADIYLANQFPPPKPIQDEDSKEKTSAPEVKRKLSLTEKQLMEYAGKYYSEELDTHYLILYSDGKLSVKHWRNGDVILTPEDKDIFSGNQWWFRKIVFTRSNNNKINGFQLTSGRVRNLDFIRVSNVDTM